MSKYLFSRATLGLVLAICSGSACLAQRWEVGGLGGYGSYHDATITNPLGSVSIGMAPRGGFGAVFGENLYRYIGGEVRWMFIFGQPEVKFNGVQATKSGYSNLVHYDLLIHAAHEEAKLRPFLAAGAGVRVFTATGRREIGQPLSAFAVLSPVNEAEALISAGGGLKYMVKKGLQLRFDFRAYMSPTPKELFRPTGPSLVHGWIYHFVPMAGVSYVF